MEEDFTGVTHLLLTLFRFPVSVTSVADILSGSRFACPPPW